MTMSIGYILTALTSFGSSIRVLRIGAEIGGADLAHSLTLLRFISSLVSSSACLLLAFWIDNLSAVSLAACMVMLDNIADYSQAYLSGTERQSVASLSVLSQRLLPLIGALVSFQERSAAPIFITVALATCAMAWPLRRFIRPSGLNIAISGSSGYYVASFGSNIAQLELPVVGLLVEQAHVGTYAFAVRATGPLSVVGAAMQAVFVPELSKAIGTPRFDKILRTALYISIGYAVLLTAISPIFAILAPRLVGHSYPALPSLAAAAIVSAGIATVAQVLQARYIAIGRPGRSASAVIGGVVIGLLYEVVALTIGGNGLLWTCPLVMHAAVLIWMAIPTNERSNK